MADIVLTTVPESIHFYVHSHLLLKRSSNAFAFLISPPSADASMPMTASGSGSGGGGSGSVDDGGGGGGGGEGAAQAYAAAAAQDSEMNSSAPATLAAPNTTTLNPSPSFTVMPGTYPPQSAFDGVTFGANEFYPALTQSALQASQMQTQASQGSGSSGAASAPGVSPSHPSGNQSVGSGSGNDSMMTRSLSGSLGDAVLPAPPGAISSVSVGLSSSSTLVDPSSTSLPGGATLPNYPQQTASYPYPFPMPTNNSFVSQASSQSPPSAAGSAHSSQSHHGSYTQSLPTPSQFLQQQQQQQQQQQDQQQQQQQTPSVDTPPTPPGPRIFIHLHEKAEVLNLLLHAVYNLNPARYAPSLETLSYLPGALLNYGFSLDEHLSPDSELTRLYLNYARNQPVDVYALAAAYGLEYIAQKASRPSLATPLTNVTDEQVIMMGSVYLRRLIHLHNHRLEALKKILLTLPARHPRNNPVACDGTEASVLRAWALATAYLAWEARPDMSSVKLAQVLAPLLDSVKCSVCKNNLQMRISSVLSSWAQVKDTI
ncbi:hypothetical protein DL93DRAFT_2086805 [Clavulina sp. PMI_390]|nr:hypothetical protein DL93DRAFT_2086805 [Clavulina sp. PMI_390]